MAKTRWWYCNECGFSNHPRDQRRYPGAGFPPDINLTCEQCGADAKGAEQLDYKPQGVTNA